MLLSIENLHAKIDKKNVLNSITLNLEKGTIHVLMGPNGAGKTSLAMTLAGHPNFETTHGTIVFCGENLLKLKPHKRAQKGLFLSFQQPCEIEGVSIADLLRQAYNSIHFNHEKRLKLGDFRLLLEKTAQKLDLPAGFVDRNVNFGFSGGEKKRAEMLQLMILQPKLAILDEIDSGLDVNALTKVCTAIKELNKGPAKTSFLIITHYKHLIDHINPDAVHIMTKGKISESGSKILAEKVLLKGFNGNSME